MKINEYVESIQYFGQDDSYGEPKGTESSQDHVCDSDCFDQTEDEEEMAQWFEFDAYQDFTDETAIYPATKGIEYTALGLASEAGEYAGKIKKAIRDNNWDVEAMAAELGDILWYVARAAAELDLCLSDIARDNVDKLKSRMSRGKIGGSGDDR